MEVSDRIVAVANGGARLAQYWRAVAGVRGLELASGDACVLPPTVAHKAPPLAGESRND